TRQRVLELTELVVDRDAQRLKGALGRVPAAEARRRRDRGVDRLDERQRGRDRNARAPPDDRPRDRRGAALLAELAQRGGEAALVPFGDDLACAERLAGVHAHIERGVVGGGEAALARA